MAEADAEARLETVVDARGVATVALARADKHNAMDAAMIDALAARFAALGADASVRAIVLTGQGASFCAGGDLGWMKTQMEADAEARAAAARALAGMLGVVDACPKPVIGRVQGQAFGGGLGLVSVCDVAVGVETARFGLTETRLGLIPATIGPYVVARMGGARARRVFMSARIFDASEAVALGLLARAVPAEALDAAVEAEVAPYLACAPARRGARAGRGGGERGRAGAPLGKRRGASRHRRLLRTTRPGLERRMSETDPPDIDGGSPYRHSRFAPKPVRRRESRPPSAPPASPLPAAATPPSDAPEPAPARPPADGAATPAEEGGLFHDYSQRWETRHRRAARWRKVMAVLRKLAWATAAVVPLGLLAADVGATMRCELPGPLIDARLRQQWMASWALSTAVVLPLAIFISLRARNPVAFLTAVGLATVWKVAVLLRDRVALPACPRGWPEDVPRHALEMPLGLVAGASFAGFLVALAVLAWTPRKSSTD